MDKKALPELVIGQGVVSTPHRARTCNLRFRRPMLYPIELGVQVVTIKGLTSSVFFSTQGGLRRVE